MYYRPPDKNTIAYDQPVKCELGKIRELLSMGHQHVRRNQFILRQAKGCVTTAAGELDRMKGIEDDNVERLSQMGFGLEEEDLRLALTLYSNNVNIAVVALTQEVKDRKDEEITPPSPPSPLSVSISST